MFSSIGLATPPFWGYLRTHVLSRDDNRCQVSGCPSRLSLHLHHKIPRAKGGAHTPENLITLCEFHHALEGDGGHQRIWPKVQTQFFTLVREHDRRNRHGSSTHHVRAFLRRLELISIEELKSLHEMYGFVCCRCDESFLKYTLITSTRKIRIVCTSCGTRWTGPQQLTEETGPRLAELLVVTRNRGTRRARWDVLNQRTGNAVSETNGGWSVINASLTRDRADTLSQSAEKLERIKSAIKGRKRLYFLYESKNGVVTEREILPQALKQVGQTSYVVGHCFLRDESRTFAVERIQMDD